MTKRFAFIVVWSIAFWLGSAFLIGFASGSFFFFQAFTAGPNTELAGTEPAGFWVFVPLTAGVVGFVLGIFGKLPGTHGSTKKSLPAPSPL